MTTDHSKPPAENASALYRAVWRWHFYAGIVVAPLVIFLAITGATYLWKPQYEAWRYRDLFTVPATETTALSADLQLKAALAVATVEWRVSSFQPNFASDQTSQINFKRRDSKNPFGPGLTIFVNPHSGAVVGQLDDETRLMQLVHDLHGTLLAGKAGEYVV